MRVTTLTAIIAAAAVAAAACPRPLSAAAVEFVGTVGDTLVRRAEAGERLTVVFPIRNSSVRPRRLETAPLLPPSWRLLSGGGPVELAAGTTGTVFVQVHVPGAAAPGEYEIGLGIREPGGSRDPEVHTIRVRVATRHAIEVVALDAPRLALAGSGYTARFIVRNRGNARARVHVEALEHAGYVATPEWRDAELEAGAAREVTVGVQTSADRPRVLRHLVELHARAARTDRADSAAAVAAASTSVLVIPPNDVHGGARFHELPLEARVLVTPGYGRGGQGTLVTGELSGSGPVADGSATRATFRVRASHDDVNGRRPDDEYMIAIDHQRAGIRIGDGVYRLSTLTEPGRPGLGTAVRAQVGDLGVHAIAARNRHLEGAPLVVGAGASYRVGAFASAGANVLRRTGADAATIGGLHLQSHALPLANADVEIAQDAGAAAARAISASLSGANERLSYALQHLDVPLAYPSVFAGMQSDAATAALRLVGPLRVHASATSQRTSRPTGPWQHGAGTVRSMEVGLGLGNSLTIAHSRTRVAHDTTTGAADGAESMFRVHLRGAVGPLTVSANALAGRVERQEGPSTASELAAQASLRIGGRASLAGSVQHTTGARWNTRAAQVVSTATVRAMLSPISNLAIDLGASASRRRAPVHHDFLAIDGAVRYRTPFGHTVSLAARTQSSGTLGALVQPVFQLGYAVPLGIPVGQSRQGSRMVGRIYDSETGKGIPNAVVVVGEQMALTDAEGRLAMNGLPAGAHQVQLQLPGAVSDRVPLQSTPLLVATAPGPPVRVEIPMVRAARITGTVRRLAPPSEAQWDGARATLSDVASMPGLVVTLSRDGEVQRRVTDADGVFDAVGLRPGQWTIAVDPADLPAHHYLDTPTQTVELSPGQQVATDFRVLPRKRTVVMIDQAVVTAGTPPQRTREPAVEPSRKPVPTATRPATAEESPGARGRFYVAGEADRTLENVAIWVYGDARLWPKLWLANRGVLRAPDAVDPGTLLVIPPAGPLTAAEIAARDALRQDGRPPTTPSPTP